MDRAQQVADASEEMAALRKALAQERPVVLKAIEMFGAEMYRKGVMETVRAAREREDDVPARSASP